MRLQRHGFQWEDDSYDNLVKKYPNAKCALKWWCNAKGDGSHFNIERSKWLKEFIIKNPPTFNISNKCCDYSKKNPIHNYYKDNKVELNIVGVRKAEGGIRSVAYKSCFDKGSNGYDNYRPLFWYTDDDKRDYEKAFEIKHSDCYEKWGFKRTGCVGCPYSRNLQQELDIAQKYEPNVYKACNNIFKDSYEYTKQYREFCKRMKRKNSGYKELF